MAMQETLLIWQWGCSGLGWGGPQFLSLERVLMAGGKAGLQAGMGLCGPGWSVYCCDCSLTCCVMDAPLSHSG